MRNRVRVAALALLRPPFPPPEREDMGKAFERLRERVAPITMTTPEGLFALDETVNYLEAAKIPGDFVECGVWRGGSSMMAARPSTGLGYSARSGCTTRSRACRRPMKMTALEGRRSLEGGQTPQHLGVRDARRRPREHPTDLLLCVEGKVRNTIPAEALEAIALLRLDTDWDESTRHELIHL